MNGWVELRSFLFKAIISRGSKAYSSCAKMENNLPQLKKLATYLVALLKMTSKVIVFTLALSVTPSPYFSLDPFISTLFLSSPAFATTD